MLENEYNAEEIIINPDYTISIGNVLGDTLMLSFDNCQDKCTSMLSFQIDDIDTVQRLHDEIGIVLKLMKKEKRKKEDQ